MARPSALQRGRDPPSVDTGTRRRSARLLTTISGRPDSSDSSASQRPSGEKAGAASSNGPSLNAIGSPPPAGTIATAVRPAGSVIVTATRPSAAADDGKTCAPARAIAGVLARSATPREATPKVPDARVAKKIVRPSADQAGETL